MADLNFQIAQRLPLPLYRLLADTGISSAELERELHAADFHYNRYNHWFGSFFTLTVPDNTERLQLLLHILEGRGHFYRFVYIPLELQHTHVQAQILVTSLDLLQWARPPQAMTDPGDAEPVPTPQVDPMPADSA